MATGSSTRMVIAVSEDKVMERDAQQVDDGETMEAFSNQTEMDPKLWSKLADDLVEEIITRLPLKDIVQSQVLAKKWRSRFQSSSFQQGVSTFSSRWGPSNFYHPLWLTEEGLYGYDRSTQKWTGLCTLPDFPSDFNETASTVAGSKWRLWGRNCFVVGALVFSGHVSKDGLLHMFVTNVVNKTARRCPPVKFPRVIEESQLQSMNILRMVQFHVHPVGHHHYKLVMVKNVYRDDFDILIVNVYDSKLNSWIKFQYDFSRNQRRSGNAVYLRGVIYEPCISFEGEPPYESGFIVFLTFDVDKGLFRNIIPPQPVPKKFGGTFVAWRSQLVRVSYYRDPINFALVEIAISTVNLQTLEFTEILRLDPEVWSLGLARTSDRNCWAVSGIALSDIDPDCMHLILELYANNNAEVEEGFQGFQGLMFDNKVPNERMILVSCDLSKRLLSHSLVDSCKSGHTRDERMEISKFYKFQPNLSPFVLA